MLLAPVHRSMHWLPAVLAPGRAKTSTAVPILVRFWHNPFLSINMGLRMVFKFDHSIYVSVYSKSIIIIPGYFSSRYPQKILRNSHGSMLGVLWRLFYFLHTMTVRCSRYSEVRSPSCRLQMSWHQISARLSATTRLSLLRLLTTIIRITHVTHACPFTHFRWTMLERGRLGDNSLAPLLLVGSSSRTDS